MDRKLAKVIAAQSEAVSSILKSLAHPVRLKVLCMVLEEEKSVGNLTDYCGISQSAMSQFLGRMKNEGLLRSRREGQRMLYAVADPKLFKLLKAIKEIYC